MGKARLQEYAQESYTRGERVERPWSSTESRLGALRHPQARATYLVIPSAKRDRSCHGPRERGTHRSSDRSYRWEERRFAVMMSGPLSSGRSELEYACLRMLWVGGQA